MNRSGSTRRGLTLVEMLVVIAIIGVLVALLLPAVQAARESARRADCGQRLRQVGLALQQHLSLRGSLPKAGTSINPATTQLNIRDYDADPANRMVWAGATWVVFILPYIEQKSLADAYDQSRGAVERVNNAVTSKRLPAFTCPSHPPQPAGNLLRQPVDMFNAPAGGYSAPLPSTSGFIGFERVNFAVNVGANMLQQFSDTTNAAFKGPFSVVAQYGAPAAALQDGSSNVIVGGEIVNPLTGGSGDSRGAWGWPGGSVFCGRIYRGGGAYSISTPNTQAANDAPPYSNNDSTNPIFNLRAPGDGGTGSASTAARSFHPGGCNFVFADGSQRFIADQVDSSTYGNLLAIADGKAAGSY
jgi:prepilin-type N-terminal cleavage/methylation domain-containing protein/prepilin-type processing-associated H-X9-DG protein